MKRRTLGLSFHHHPDFLIDVGESPRSLSEAFLGWLRSRVERGTVFQPGETVRFASSLLRVRATDAFLTLAEPEPGSLPIRWRNGVERTLLTLAQQQFVAESVGTKDRLDAVNPLAPAFTCTAADPKGPLAFTRHEPLENGASWCVLCLDPDHDHDDPDNLRLESLYALGTRFPFFELMWALPVGVCVVYRPGVGFDVGYQKPPTPVPRGSFLDTLARHWESCS